MIRSLFSRWSEAAARASEVLPFGAPRASRRETDIGAEVRSRSAVAVSSVEIRAAFLRYCARLTAVTALPTNSSTTCRDLRVGKGAVRPS
jgi:hypothetical protein